MWILQSDGVASGGRRGGELKVPIALESTNNRSEIEGITIQNKEQQERTEREKEKGKNKEKQGDEASTTNTKEPEKVPDYVCSHDCKNHSHIRERQQTPSTPEDKGKEKDTQAEGNDTPQSEPSEHAPSPDRELADLIEELDPMHQPRGPATFQNVNIVQYEENQKQKERCVKLLDAFIVAVFCCLALLIWKKFFVV